MRKLCSAALACLAATVAWGANKAPLDGLFGLKLGDSLRSYPKLMLPTGELNSGKKYEKFKAWPVKPPELNPLLDRYQVLVSPTGRIYQIIGLSHGKCREEFPVFKSALAAKYGAPSQCMEASHGITLQCNWIFGTSRLLRITVAEGRSFHPTSPGQKCEFALVASDYTVELGETTKAIENDQTRMQQNVTRGL